MPRPRKWTNEDGIAVRKLASEGLSWFEIARKLGMHGASVKSILTIDDFIDFKACRPRLCEACNRVVQFTPCVICAARS